MYNEILWEKPPPNTDKSHKHKIIKHVAIDKYTLQCYLHKYQKIQNKYLP